MDHKLTQEIRRWIETPDKKKDILRGAMLLLKLSGNRHEWQKILSNPTKHLAYLTGRLEKYLKFRLMNLTKEQVSQMNQEADAAVADIEQKATQPGSGRRPDHDSLSEEIRALYIENQRLAARMAELHSQARSRSVLSSPCPDSERYPFISELLKLNKQRLANWARYDAAEIVK